MEPLPPCRERNDEKSGAAGEVVLVLGHRGVAARRRRVVRGHAAPAAGGEAQDQAVPASWPISVYPHSSLL